MESQLPANLPNFFILGAAKAGTSSLYHYLRQHPAIYLPQEKEPHFFDDDRSYAKGLSYYTKRHYKGAEKFPARGDATPAYLHRYQLTIPRIQETYGAFSPRFLIMLRDPVQRAWSHYLHRVRNAAETETFQRALELEDVRLAENGGAWVGYFRDGLYANQVAVWLQHFPRSSFKFILTEDLSNDVQGVLRACFTFLTLPNSLRIDTHTWHNRASEARFPQLMRFLSQKSLLKNSFKRLFPSPARKSLKLYLRRKNLRPVSGHPELDPQLAADLRERYRYEVTELSHLIDRDLSRWLAR